MTPSSPQTSRLTVSLSLNPAPLCTAIDELSSLLKHTGERGLEFGQALVRLIHSGEELVSIKRDIGAAAVTGEMVIGAYPSEGLGRLLAAARAGDFDTGLVEQVFRHGSGSAGCLDNASEDRAPGESQGLPGAGAAS